LFLARIHRGPGRESVGPEKTRLKKVKKTQGGEVVKEKPPSAKKKERPKAYLLKFEREMRLSTTQGRKKRKGIGAKRGNECRTGNVAKMEISLLLRSQEERGFQVKGGGNDDYQAKKRFKNSRPPGHYLLKKQGRGSGDANKLRSTRRDLTTTGKGNFIRA